MDLKLDTICALATGSGIGAIAVVRISGPNSRRILSKCFSKDLSKAETHTIHFGTISSNDGAQIDEVLVSYFEHGRSFTGEESIEVSCHGSPYVQQQILAVLQHCGCRMAEPGEFTKLAFQNGKINLLKAESIGDLISAETEIQRLQAIKVMKGKSSEKFNQLREKLLKILSFIEAKIDFPEEDLPEENLKKIKQDSSDVLNEINKILDDQKVGEIIREGFKIAIVGPTNAGKSSLLNNLSNREVAIVSEIAGTTRDVVETHLNIDGYPVIISDTAGIRDSKDEIEKKGIKEFVHDKFKGKAQRNCLLSGKKRSITDKIDICEALVLRALGRKGYEHLRKNGPLFFPSSACLDKHVDKIMSIKQG